VDFGIENGLTPGIDPIATPACANACIADALHFGDADDPNSNVSQLLREQRNFRMHAELGTDPGFYYLYGQANDPEKESDVPATGSGLPGGQMRTRGIEPSRQQHWDWKAAGNFICGGMGSGLFLVAAVASLRYPELASLGLVALGLIGFGLFLVLLKIGRPLRSIYVLRQPQRSWMAREAWIAAFLFPVAGTALWSRAPMLLVTAALGAALFLCSQAMILKEAKGIPAWRVFWILPLVMVTGLAEGSGLFLTAVAHIPALDPLAQLAAAITVALAALRAWIWRSYQAVLAAEGAPTRTLTVLHDFRSWFFAGGLAVPSVLIIPAILVGIAPSILFSVAGVCIAVTGVALKFILVTRAGFNQGFALVHTPVRGSGVAGLAVKPGWSQP
jgi:phenylacetyl-CoA:acceptor oxidoreductase subunit 2